ncbi:SIR2 family protein [Candidatus Aerophobetes bacterium]|nr:SIR2 family protein [Candidatus Aerophobetes bacterium]
MVDIDINILNSLVDQFVAGKVSIVVGSGASDYNRFGVPVLKQKLLENLKLEQGGQKQLRVNTLSHINKEPSECSLEELLSIYSKIYNKPIDLFLIQQGIRPKSEISVIPPLGYEIISHFISHRLVDNVISFNFDECLEVSLDDEIGEDSYEWVRSKSIFQKVAEEIEFRKGALPRKPLLIKPHGTISYPATIRPTFETVQQFEKEKQDLLEKIFNDSAALLIIGFSCPDPDFQKVLKKLVLTEGRKIFWVDTNKDFPSNNDMFKFAKSILKNNCIFVSANADNFLVKLADYLHKKHKERYPTITRHKFRNHFGQWGALDSIENLLKLETIIYAIKTRGMFSLEGLLMCKRIDNYCKKMPQFTIKNIFEEIVNTGILKKNENITSAEAYYIPIFNSCRTIASEVLRMFSILNGNDEKEQLLLGLTEELMRDFDFDFGRIDNYLYLKFYESKIIKDFHELYQDTRRTILSAQEEIRILLKFVATFFLCSFIYEGL